MKTRIEATPNYRERTFTLRRKDKGKTTAKYRTIKMGNEEFKDKLYYTSKDWLNFLQKTYEYILV